MSEKAKYPETLYVQSQPKYYFYAGEFQLVGEETLGSMISHNGKENDVAIYKLVEVKKYKRVTTSVIEEVK